MGGAIETALEPLKEALDFFMKNASRLTVEFLKLSALSMLVQILFFAGLFAILMAGGAGSIDGGGAMGMAAIALALLLFLAFTVLGAAISATAYPLVQEMTKGKGIGILAKARELLVPIGKYTLIIWGVMLAMLVAFFVMTGAAGSLGPLVSVLGVLVLLVILAAFVFVTQFSVPEIALRGAGPVDGIRRSWNTVAGNIWAVIVFDIVLLIVVIGTGLMFSIAQGFANAIMVSSGDLASMAAGVLASLAISFVQSVVIALLTVPPIYFFWKKVSR
ncbi:MAG: hypothetical protein AB1529_07425 [Candidatus Micrarchaeota archaeon]